MRDFVSGYLLLGLAGSLLSFFLDAGAFFSLLSYTPLYIAVLGYGAVGCRWVAGEFRNHRRTVRAYSAVLGAAFLVIALGLILPYLKTSARKGFHIDAGSLRPGMSVATIRRAMDGYQVYDRIEEGYLAFSFRVNAQTEDRIIVELTPAGVVKKIEVTTN